ncbi:hypothetical protein EIP86_000775 [Pleurotus ostreatoroseus]|nr:hypothetical protein EIP86_000775 [Pleurotus ostreatoroseus]
MGRRKGVAPKPRGRRSAKAPEIIDYLTRHKVDYYAATEAPIQLREGDNITYVVKQQTTRFLDSITNLVMHKYGIDVDMDAPIAQDPPDPDEKLADESPRRPDWTEEQVEEFERKWEKLRKKISNWYNNNAARHSRQDTESVKSKLKYRLMRETARHHKLSLFQFYQREHYQERISPRFQQLWREAMEAWESDKAAAAANNVEFDVPAPKQVAIRTSAAKTCMEAEDDAFIQDLKERWQHDIQEESAQHQAMMGPPETPEEFQLSIDAVPTILQDFADAITEVTGMVTTILIGGPVPAKGGRLETKTIHSGLSKGPVPLPWYKADRAGFIKVCDIFQSFVESAYSNEDQNARAIPGTLEEAQASSTAAPHASSEALPVPPQTVGTRDQPATAAQASSVPDQTPAPSHSASQANAATPDLRSAGSVPASTPNAHEGDEHQVHESPAQPPNDDAMSEGFADADRERLARPTPEPAPGSQPSATPDQDLSLGAEEAWSMAASALSEFPDILQRSYGILISTAPDWGAPWVSCVNMLIAIEQTSPPSKAQLSTVDRPVEFDDWFKHRRPAALAKVDPSVFGPQFNKWWRTLQPKARILESGGLMRQSLPESEWTSLRKPGKSGFFLLLLGLAWWRASMADSSEQTLWQEAVDDVLWALQEWKRDLSEADSPTPPSSPSVVTPPSSPAIVMSPPPSSESSSIAPAPQTISRRSTRKALQAVVLLPAPSPSLAQRRSKRGSDDTLPVAKRLRNS